MKTLSVILVVCFLCCSAFAESNPDLSSLLENEPVAASHSFVETQGSADATVSFREDGSSTDSSTEESEYDGQIAQVEEDIKRVKDQIKESEECAHRLAEQRSELRTLNENRERLLKEKEKLILQTKLEKQMRDLAEINRMSRTLRTKFAELKRTQQMIKTRLTGTKASLNQLEGAPDLTTEDIKDSSNSILKEVDDMHKSQKGILERTQTINSKAVKDEVKGETLVNLQGRTDKGSVSLDDDV